MCEEVTLSCVLHYDSGRELYVSLDGDYENGCWIPLSEISCMNNDGHKVTLTLSRKLAQRGQLI